MDRDVESHTAGGQNCQLADAPPHLSQAIKRALDRLLKAHQYAEETGHNAWEFAVTIAELRRDGVSESDLRWLACREYVEHAKETTRGAGDRTFDRLVNLRLSKRTAFVITSTGVALRQSLAESVEHWDRNAQLTDNSANGAFESAPSTVALVARRGFQAEIQPQWDRDRRELRLAGELVKVFKLPSPMQEAILMAFEEEHWPPRIDDPLPSHPELLPKRRLHDTIKSLNRNQKSALIRFMGDGTGEGVRWEMVIADELLKPSISLLG